MVATRSGRQKKGEGELLEDAEPLSTDSISKSDADNVVPRRNPHRDGRGVKASIQEQERMEKETLASCIQCASAQADSGVEVVLKAGKTASHHGEEMVQEKKGMADEPNRIEIEGSSHQRTAFVVLETPLVDNRSRSHGVPSIITGKDHKARQQPKSPSLLKRVLSPFNGNNDKTMETVQSCAKTRLNDPQAENPQEERIENRSGDPESSCEGVYISDDNSESGTLCGVNRTILCFPFHSDIDDFELSAEGLLEVSRLVVPPFDKNSSVAHLETVGRSVMLQETDLARLQPLKHLSDQNVSFWMRWITRNLPATSRIHIVDSYFYTKLSEDGVEAVGKWTKRIDSFSMDIILIPVNQDKHWTLCAAINPSAIINSRRSVKYQSDDDARPLFIFMDSMDAHDPGQICANLRSWLNYHWNKKVGKEKLGLRSTNPFQANEMPVVSPYVPKQPNCKDWGVYICRNASSLLMLYTCTKGIISTYDIDCSELISKSPEFNYGTSDITRLRSEMKVLVERLSASWKALQADDISDEEAVEVQVYTAGNTTLPTSKSGSGEQDDHDHGGINCILGHSILRSEGVTRFSVQVKGDSMQTWKRVKDPRALDEAKLVEYVAKNRSLRKRDEFQWIDMESIPHKKVRATKEKKQCAITISASIDEQVPQPTPEIREVGPGDFLKATPGRNKKSVFTNKPIGKVTGLKSSPFVGKQRRSDVESDTKEIRQRKGDIATRLAHLKGRTAERHRESWYRSFFVYRNSITPALRDYKNEPTATWENIEAYNVAYDPYLPPSKNGGVRPRIQLSKSDRPSMIITARDKKEEDNFKEMMLTAVKANFESTDELDIIFVKNVKDAVKASKGDYHSKVNFGPKHSAPAGIRPISALFEDEEAVPMDVLFI